MRILVIAFLGICLSVLTGCSRGVGLFLLNNTQSTVEVVVRGNSLMIPSHTGLGFPPNPAPDTVVLRVGEESLTYSFVGQPLLPAIKVNGIRFFYLQLQESGDIYALSKATEIPVAVLPPQPSGLPMHPTRTKVK